MVEVFIAVRSSVLFCARLIESMYPYIYLL